MFPDDHENYVGTDKQVACSTEGAGWPDVDPFDVAVNGKADEEYKRRLDLFGPDGEINAFDIMQYYIEPAANGADCPHNK